ncbi:mitochondrial 37S ribosomal protein mS23 [Kwoniella pini CBS 10737]|uniref:Small ribosomal subunit protein mS23 n=1 Tax=Kwoniella pini CBS 10737 TaxID=1296096 RepID=A0A1B9I7U7_9TREE|nr:uncharacterized protein I206_02281 [Kwoniella pini CBS 10737]OCF51566.1 hypothetical protein I206_02281 [Kwoniella pini CBS 10737]
MRRIPSQVPQAVSRLLQGNVIQQPPTWYIPVLSNPPPVLPARQTVQRNRPINDSIEERDSSDLAYIPKGELERRDKLRKFKTRKNKPERIVYLRDKIRRQFFKDFAFEALRPISLIENQEITENNKIDGENWIKLEQRGLYPTVEDTISFVINIQKTRSIPISDAYAIATREFIKLRARHEQSTIAAEIEARYYGAEFKPDAFERQFNLEEKSLSTLINSSNRQSFSNSNSENSSKSKFKKLPRWQWSNSLSPSTLGNLNEFTNGLNYIENWKLPLPPKESILNQSELLSSIPIQSDQSTITTNSSSTSEESENDLAFLTSVLGKSRT